MIGNPRESLLALLGGRGEVEEEFRRTRLFPGEMDMLEDVASVAVRQKLGLTSSLNCKTGVDLTSTSRNVVHLLYTA